MTEAAASFASLVVGTGEAILFYACILFVAVEGEIYNKNNPNELKNSKVFLPSHGRIFELYSSEGEIRNILVPISKSLKNLDFSNPNDDKHPPVYFNLFKNGQNDGVYLLKNKIARKISNGTDSTTDLDGNNFNERIVYLSSSDGIYTFNSNTEELKKFGTITEEFKAIDKVDARKDEIYVLAGDNKIYKITSQGTVKTIVDGIDYAKDFVVDVTGTIYFLDENSKPRVLYNGSTNSEEVTGLNFDVKNAFLCRIPWNLNDVTRTTGTVPFIVDGVCYALMNNTAMATIYGATVQGVTAFSVECSFLHFYGLKGRIYMHDLMARNPSTVQQKRGPTKDSHIEIFDRDVNEDYNVIKAKD